MQLHKIYIILFVLTILAASCRHLNTKQTAYLRGKIVNPRADNVIISRDFLMLQSDTLGLLSENEVAGPIKVPEEGLYIIYIFPEYQTIYLKPGDSLAFHLNVDEFDESISFSGSSGFENNLMMSVFLIDEQESDYFYRHNFQFDLQNFNRKIDSFQNLKKRTIESYREELAETSQLYQNILSLLAKSMDFNLKEVYAQKHTYEKLSPDFFAYCSVLHRELPDPNIIYMYAFADSFLERQLKSEKTKIKNPYWKISEIIDREIYDSKFKDNLLVKYCSRYIKGKLVAEKDATVNNFYQKIKSRLYKDYCDSLIAKNKLMQEGNHFPESFYLTIDKRRLPSDSLFPPGSKTLVSFWDLRFRKNFVSNLKKMEAFQKAYPDMQLVVINTNAGYFDEWLLQKPVSSHMKFVQAIDRKQVNKIKPFLLSQVYLLDGNKIKASMRNMYAPGFDKELRKFNSEK